MLQIQGRLTADAQFKTLENGKTVVNFSIAENQGYKPKDGGEYVNIATFFNVAYYTKSEKILTVLRKGAIVLIDGRIKARIYETNTGDWDASLNLLAHNINVTAFAKKTAEEPVQEEKPRPKSGKVKGNSSKKAEATTANDDLPF